MDLCDIQQIKALLSRHGFHFSKSMGQNFLVEDWVPRDIAEASGASPSCGVLEVGPGIGPLTQDLGAGKAGREGGLCGAGPVPPPHPVRDHGRPGKCGDRSRRYPED